MDVYDPIDQAVRAIVNLGIASPATVAPHVAAWRERPPGEDTQDEDTELAGFLTALHQAGVLTRTQGRTLLAMLTGTTAGGMPPDDPYVGHRFGSYIAEAKIGEGGMGKVYRAARVGSLESHYVVKVFSATDDPQAQARFRRECEVMAALDHPNVVKVFAAGEEGTLPYLVLEYVEGPTLQELVEERGKFNWKSATRAVKQIASALAGAHEQNVIHRDIKPHNILVARGGILKVFDFGLAKAMDSKVVSHAGEILGSPAYMAPEQWGDHEVDHRADLYALGVVYYLLLGGQLPFKGRTPADYSWKIQAGRYDPLATIAPDVPAPVCHVVTQLLERDRNHRPPHARALLADLDRILRGQFPDVPRLEPVDGPGEPWALLGAPSFDVGSAPQASVRLEHPSVDDRHAVLERTLGGVLLRDLEARGGSRINGRRVREIVLRDKDRLQFGEGPVLRYRAGNVGRRPGSGRLVPPSSDRYRTLSKATPEQERQGPPVVVSGLLAAALEDAAHPRALVACFEALDTRVVLAQLERSRARLDRLGLGADDASRALDRARVAAQERVWRIVDRLFRTTRENLGRSVDAWLTWWFEARTSYPRQLRAPGLRARGRLVITPSPDAPPVEVALAEHEEWSLGRADDADITVPERSVSRRHLSLLRLNTRYAFHDQGSRFGTTVRGVRKEVGLLADGDVLELGRARARFEDLPDGRTADDTVATGRLVGVDPATFTGLVDLRAPVTLEALVRLLDTPRLLDACLAAAEPWEAPEAVAPAVTAFLDDQRALALEALPAIAGVNHGEDAAAWRAWLEGARADLPRQVEPEGWGQ
ncbi:MAG: protein kinase [Planctomycetes bacterium]|nr:protein kinase [Planctomycetota bacterium]